MTVTVTHSRKHSPPFCWPMQCCQCRTMARMSLWSPQATRPLSARGRGGVAGSWWGSLPGDPVPSLPMRTSGQARPARGHRRLLRVGLLPALRLHGTACRTRGHSTTKSFCLGRSWYVVVPLHLLVAPHHTIMASCVCHCVGTTPPLPPPPFDSVCITTRPHLPCLRAQCPHCILHRRARDHGVPRVSLVTQTYP